MTWCLKLCTYEIYEFGYHEPVTLKSEHLLSLCGQFKERRQSKRSSWSIHLQKRIVDQFGGAQALFLGLSFITLWDHMSHLGKVYTVLMKRHWFWCKYKSNFYPLVYKWSGYSISRNIPLALKGAYARAICRQFQLRVFPHSYSHRQRISNDPDSGLIPQRVSPQSRARSRCLFRRAVSQSLAFYRPTMPHSNVKILVHFRFSHQSAPVRNESTCNVCAGLPCSRSVSSQERPWCGPEKKRSHLWEHGDFRSLRSRMFLSENA